MKLLRLPCRIKAEFSCSHGLSSYSQSISAWRRHIHTESKQTLPPPPLEQIKPYKDPIPRDQVSSPQKDVHKQRTHSASKNEISRRGKHHNVRNRKGNETTIKWCEPISFNGSRPDIRMVITDRASPVRLVQTGLQDTNGKERIEVSESDSSALASRRRAKVRWSLRPINSAAWAVRRRLERGQPTDPARSAVLAKRRTSQPFPPAVSEQKPQQVQSFLTRDELRGLVELGSGLREVLYFAEAMRKTPWTEEEIGEGDLELKEFFENQHSNNGPSLKPTASSSLFSFTTGRKISYSSILAGFIDLKLRESTLTIEQRDILILNLFSDEALQWLEKNGGVTVEDIVSWAWILGTESDYKAVARFLVWTNRPMPHCRVPRIVFYMLLKRRLLDPPTVQLLVTHLKHRLSNTIDQDWNGVYIQFLKRNMMDNIHQLAPSRELQTSNYTSLNPLHTAVYILMLIKSAVYPIPLLLPDLALMLCEHVKFHQHSFNVREDGLNTRSSMSLTTVFNKAIEMIARKSTEPLLSAPYQQRAQFIIIRHMNTFTPPLTIGLDAYRAIVSVQLRHRKTIKERLWAGLKSRAWPPYRENKLGIDALKKDEDYGISRAHHAIINIKEAGYGPTEWEDSASVLSGWDANKSPTIQSRRLFLDRARIRSGEPTTPPPEPLWKTRILVTRTIEEAWAVFLNYMEEDTPTSSDVFLAMFEKIVYERARTKSTMMKQGRAASSAIAGDMYETMAASHNPREQTYVPSPPPTFTAFYQQYRTHFPRLNANALCFLLPHAETLAQAYDFVRNSDLSEVQKDVLFRQNLQDVNQIYIASRILVAYIQMLSNFASEPLPNNKKISALTHAFHLVTSWKPRSRGPWRALLQAIDKELKQSRSNVLWLQQWHLVLNVLDRMEKAKVHKDGEIFYTVCSISTSIIRRASQTSPHGKYHHKVPRFESASDLRDRTGNKVKAMFKEMVTLDLRAVFSHKDEELPYLPLSKPGAAGILEDVQFRIASLLPHLLYVPSPPAIHIFVRFLGMTEDRKALFDLVRWMSMYHRELDAKSMEIARGSRQFRQALVAVRIAMESTSIPFISQGTLSDLTGLDQLYANETKQLVESIESWGGWPSNDEVEEYNENLTIPPSITEGMDV